MQLLNSLQDPRPNLTKISMQFLQEFGVRHTRKLHTEAKFGKKLSIYPEVGFLFGQGLRTTTPMSSSVVYPSSVEYAVMNHSRFAWKCRSKLGHAELEGRTCYRQDGDEVWKEATESEDGALSDLL